MLSEDVSRLENGFWFTRRRFQIFNFSKRDEDLYMCLIERPTDKYLSEEEVFLGLRGKPTVLNDQIASVIPHYSIEK